MKDGLLDDSKKSRRRSNDFLSALANFDLFNKVDDEFRVKTSSGAICIDIYCFYYILGSIFTFSIMFLLLTVELYTYFQPQRVEKISVDHKIDEKLRINFNFTFFALHCGEVNIDLMDQSGEQLINVEEHTIKQRLSPNGEAIGVAFTKNGNINETKTDIVLPPNYCGSCYGAGKPGECCNTCADVRRAYSNKGWDSKSVTSQAEQCRRDENNPLLLSKEGEGCNVYGYMETNRIAGNFHIAMGDSLNDNERHVHLFRPGEANHYNISHIIHELSFGEPYPGIYNPLSNTEFITETKIAAKHYYIQIIPTIYHKNNKIIETNQYSVLEVSKKIQTNFFGQLSALPGIFFNLDMSPFLHDINEDRPPLNHFITNVCGIIGGIFTVSKIVDMIVYKTSKEMKKH